ncbi:MAG: amidohydrolase family protein, partial [Thermoguttaceae bacterium]
LGDVALLPGLINAHTHLELSHFDHPLAQPGVRLVEWIPRLLARCAEASMSDADSIGRGLDECLRSGSTALADIASTPWPPGLLDRCPDHSAVFQELIGPTPERAASALELAQRHLATPPGGHRQWGLSPHAPYTVRPELLEAAVELAAQAGAPVAMHLAESWEEIELLETGGGPFREMLEALGAWSPGLVPAPVRPLDYLRKLAAAPRTLIIHGNYLSAREWSFLAERRERMAVVYCPRSHAHFGHAAYPLGRMLAAGVPVCLGTDSRASTPDLSLLAEMRLAAARHPDVAPATLVELGTLAAARVLGCDDALGSLAPGKRANLVAVALPTTPPADPYQAVLHGNGRVVEVVLHGVRLPRERLGLAKA